MRNNITLRYMDTYTCHWEMANPTLDLLSVSQNSLYTTSKSISITSGKLDLQNDDRGLWYTHRARPRLTDCWSRISALHPGGWNQPCKCSWVLGTQRCKRITYNVVCRVVIFLEPGNTRFCLRLGGWAVRVQWYNFRKAGATNALIRRRRYLRPDEMGVLPVLWSVYAH